MKYKIEWMETDQYKNIVASLTREDGQKLLKVNLGKEFQDRNLMPGHDIQGKEWTSPKNGKVYVFEEKEGFKQGLGEKPRVGSNSAFKTKVIEEAQQRKASSIAEAQDRSAWMWAKNNASTLLASSGRMTNKDNYEMTEEVLDLATKIYNGEPTEPFND